MNINMATDGLHPVINSSSGENTAELMRNNSHKQLTERVELDRLKKECAEMVKTLKALDQEEKRLREGNHILAQQAVIMGCTGCFDAGARRGAGRKRPASSSSTASNKKEKTAAAKKTSSSSSKTITATSKSTAPTPVSAPAPKKQENSKPPPKPVVIAKTTTNLPSQSRRKCERIINIINRHGIFTNPTHPARIAEGFVDLTIHMRVIKRKIESNSYAGSFELFKSDIRQMFDCCAQGSKEGSPFFGVITELKKMYEFELANFN